VKEIEFCFTSLSYDVRNKNVTKETDCYAYSLHLSDIGDELTEHRGVLT